MFSGALHAGNHAGFEEQRYAEDSGLQPRTCGKTTEAAEESGGSFLNDESTHEYNRNVRSCRLNSVFTTRWRQSIAFIVAALLTL